MKKTIEITDRGIKFDEAVYVFSSKSRRDTVAEIIDLVQTSEENIRKILFLECDEIDL